MTKVNVEDMMRLKNGHKVGHRDVLVQCGDDCGLFDVVLYRFKDVARHCFLRSSLWKSVKSVLPNKQHLFSVCFDLFVILTFEEVLVGLLID